MFPNFFSRKLGTFENAFFAFSLYYQHFVFFFYLFKRNTISVISLRELVVTGLNIYSQFNESETVFNIFLLNYNFRQADQSRN